MYFGVPDPASNGFFFLSRPIQGRLGLDGTDQVWEFMEGAPEEISANVRYRWKRWTVGYIFAK